MKTPWSNLLKNYGTASAAFIVISLASIGLMLLVGVGVVLNKILVFIK